MRIELPILGSVIGFFLSLVALYWLILRGMTWADAMRQIGLHRGAGWWRELFAGMAGYAMMLPIWSSGSSGCCCDSASEIALKFEGLRSQSNAPIHRRHVRNASIPELILVFVVACVAAPDRRKSFMMCSAGLPSDRSTLGLGKHRHQWPCLGLHIRRDSPQGMVAIPALGAIGFAMALARE